MELAENPRRTGRARRYARKVGGRLFAGLNIKSAIHEGIPFLAGIFAAKLGARKWGGGTELDPNTWTWKTYLMGGLGAFGGAMLANMFRPGMGQKVLNGGIGFLIFKLVEHKLVAGHPTAEAWFGADESWGYAGFGADDPNVLQLDGEGTPWMMSEAGPLPLDERHRMPELDGFYGADDDLPEMQGTWGEALVSPGRLGSYGEALVSPGRLGQDVREDYLAKYRQAYQS